MSLLITITKAPDSVAMAESSKSFDAQGGTIGRGKDNAWVLEDPERFLSTVHASIAQENGQFTLTDMSTNGTFFNGADHPIGKGSKQPLSDGDIFVIGDYEFAVSLWNPVDTPAEAAAAAAGPFSGAGSAPDPMDELLSGSAQPDDDLFSSSTFSAGPGHQNDPLFPTQTEETDPLAAIDKAQGLDNSPLGSTGFSQNMNGPNGISNDPFASQSTADPFNSQSFSDQADPMQQQVSWPETNAEPLPGAGSGGVIPDDWDDDLLSPQSTAPVVNPAPVAPPQTPPQPVDAQQGMGSSAAADPAAFNAPSPGLNPGLNPGHNLGGLNPGAQQPQAIPPQGIPLEAEQPAQVAPQVAAPSPGGQAAGIAPAAREPRPEFQNTGVFDASEGEISAVQQQALQKANAKIQAELDILKKQVSAQQRGEHQVLTVDTTLTDAMGFTDKHLQDEDVKRINTLAGEVLREMTGGLMQVLGSRSSIKNEFRMNVTTIQPIENNPLKFSANVDDALENMFLKSGNAYKKPIEAVQEGFQGIAEHQVAILAGIRAAFKGVLERFDPEKLEQRFAKLNKGGLIPGSQKAKNWELYQEYFQEVAGDVDHSFQDLFGDEFVQAYEDQLQKLAIARRPKKKASS